VTDNALIVSSNGNGIARFAPREDVRELTNRLLAMHPAAQEVGEPAMRAAAQLALLLGANPLPGVNEMHIWRDNKGRNCMSLGINYWRRKAEEWGGVLYEIRPRLMKTAEAAEYGVPNGTTAAICKAVRANDMIRYRQMGFTANEVWDMCGRTGVGTATANEYAKAGRPPSWTALKRAETDMLRQLFPAEFGRVDREMITTDASMVIAPDGDVIEGNVTEGDPQPRYTLADANADLFGNGASYQAATEGDDAPEDGEYEDDTPPAPQPPAPATNGNGGDIDPLAAAIMALPNSDLAFSSAAGATRFIAALTKDAPRVDNAILEAADRAIASKADGATVKAAADAAIQWYKTAAQPPAQADWLGGNDDTAQRAALATAQGQLD
jgi:hypothetical protein